MLYLHGIGHFHPENIVDNAFLGSLDIGTNDQWIMERVGIKSRRTVLSLDYIRETRNRDPRAASEASLYTDAQTAALAAKMALERANLKASDIGMVISGGCSTQWALPTEACRIAAEIGIEGPAIDLNSGCSTFGAILHFINSMRPEAVPKFILVVNPEASTRVMDYSNRNSSVLFGDCTTAAIVSNTVPSRARVDYSTLDSDPKGWKAATVPMGGFFAQEGKTVQGFAIRRTTSTFKELRFQAAKDPKSLFFIGHQANMLMLEGVCRHSEIDEAHHLYNVQDFGNCASAGAPSVLSQNWETFQADDELAMVVVGSGLSWSSLHFQFT